MGKNLLIKQELVEAVSKDIQDKGEVNAFVVNYSKLSSVDMNALKTVMYKTEGKLTVIKNTLIKRILEKSGVELESEIEGQNALLVPGKDLIAPLKDLFDFIKKADKGAVAFGVLNGKIISGDQVKELASLPSREVLLARLLGGFNSPIRGFAYTLNGVQGNFVRALNAIKDKKQ